MIKLSYSQLASAVAAVLLGACSSVPPAPTLQSTPAGQVARANMKAIQQATQLMPASAGKAVAATRPKATGSPEDARRHIVRGAAAIEIAKTPEDLALAADEFRMATEIAPGMAAGWFNLGAVLAKTDKIEDSINAYRQYLMLAPNADDAQRVRDEIIKLEFRQERQVKEQTAAGEWIESDGTIYGLMVAGQKWKLFADKRPFDPDVDDRYGLGFGPLEMSGMNRPVEKITFNLDVRSGKASGTWQHDEITVDRCTIPTETGPVEGEADLAQGKISLTFTKARYNALSADPPIFSFDVKRTCQDVSVITRRPVTFEFVGPLPAGGIGISPSIEHGFTRQITWAGELTIVGVAENSAAADAGLSPGDRILAIDGVDVKTLSAGQAISRLRGAPGSVVELLVKREDQLPVSIKLERYLLPQK